MKYDVVIVGASSAGLYAAELLAKGGKRVALFEREQEISPAKRTYIITPGIFRVFPDFPGELIRHQTDQIQIQAGGRSTLVQLKAPDLVVDRRQLITQMLHRAKAAGAEIYPGNEFLGLDFSAGSAALKIRDQTGERILEADQLIGADGLHSQVRVSSGLDPLPWVPLLQAEIGLPRDWDSRVTQVWFNPDLTPYFFWMIPDIKQQAVVGLISPQGTVIRQLLDEFLKQYDLECRDYQTGKAACYKPASSSSKVVRDLPIYLVGDAAGQVKVTTVGGTVTGLAGAKAVAERILNQPQHERSYRSIRKELNLHCLIRRLLNKMTSGDYRSLIGLISPAVKNFLSRYDRDEMRWNFWKLIYFQPRLVPLGLRLVIRVFLSGPGS